MKRQYRKAAAVRTLLGLALVWAVAAIRDSFISARPEYDRQIELSVAFVLAMILYVLVFKPLIDYSEWSRENGSQGGGDDGSAT